MSAKKQKQKRTYKVHVEFWIDKVTRDDLAYGRWWDGPFKTEKKARLGLDERYGSGDKGTFYITRVTTQRLP